MDLLLVNGGEEEQESLQPSVLGAKVLQLKVCGDEIVELLQQRESELHLTPRLPDELEEDVKEVARPLLCREASVAVADKLSTVVVVVVVSISFTLSLRHAVGPRETEEGRTISKRKLKSSLEIFSPSTESNRRTNSSSLALAFSSRSIAWVRYCCWLSSATNSSALCGGSSVTRAPF